VADGVTTEADMDGVTVRWSVAPVQDETRIARRVAARPRVLKTGAGLVVVGMLALLAPIAVFGAPAGITIVNETLIVPITPVLLGLVVLGLAALIVGFALVVLGSPRAVIATRQAHRIRGHLRIDARGLHLGRQIIPWYAVESLDRTPGGGRVTISHQDQTLVVIEGVDDATAWAVAETILEHQPELAELDEGALRAVQHMRGRNEA